MSLTDSQLIKLSQLIENSKNIVVLTGAGISTDSGIPDFRSVGGVWEDKEILHAMTDQYLNHHPKEFWPKYKHVFMTEELLSARPNLGHFKIAQLEEMGKNVTVVTQNVDGLHQAAGSSNVIEVHGSAHSATCPKCQEKYDLEYILQNDIPRCTKCNANMILHPDIVLFGQAVHDMYYAETQVREADLLLVLGTGLEVYPVAGLPNRLKYGKHMAIINMTPTPFGHKASVDIRDGISEVLSQVI